MPKVMIDRAGAPPAVKTPASSSRKDEALLADPGFAAIFAMAVGQAGAGFPPVPTPPAGPQGDGSGATTATAPVSSLAVSLAAAPLLLAAAQSPAQPAGLIAPLAPGAAGSTALGAVQAVAAAGINPAVIFPGGLLPGSGPLVALPATPAPTGAALAASPHLQTGQPGAQVGAGSPLVSGPALMPGQPDASTTQAVPLNPAVPPTQAVPPNQALTPNQAVPPNQALTPNQALPPNQPLPADQVLPPNQVLHPDQALHPDQGPPPNQVAPPTQVLTPHQQVTATQQLGSDQQADPNRPAAPPTPASEREQEKALALPPIVQGASHGLRLASEFSAVKADAAAGPPRLPQTIDQVMERVHEFVTRAQDGTYTLTLRLHPEHLGEVRLHLIVAGREIQTLMAAQNPAAQQALARGGEQLRQNLDQAGYTLTGFQVSTGEGGGASAGRQPARDFQAPDRGQPGGLTGPAGPAGPATASLQPRTPLRPGGLDTMA